MSIFILWTHPYFRWLFLFVFVPTTLLWFFFWKTLLGYKKTILFILVLSLVGGFCMDVIASPILGIWHFNSTQGLQIYIFGLPLAEYAFLLFVPQEIVCIFLLVRRKMLYGKI